MILLAGGAAVTIWMLFRYFQGSSSSTPAAVPIAPSVPPTDQIPLASPLPSYSDPAGSSSASAPARAVSLQGQLFIQQHEGFSLTPYGDAGGHAIYWGHKIKPGEHFNHTMTEARAVFAHDLAHVENIINGHVHVPLSQNQYDALADFVYNTGSLGGTLLQKLNAGDYAGAAQTLGLYVHSAGHVSQGLIARRQAEAQLFGVA